MSLREGLSPRAGTVRALQEQAEKFHGIDYLQVFNSAVPGKPDLGSLKTVLAARLPRCFHQIIDGSSDFGVVCSGLLRVGRGGNAKLRCQQVEGSGEILGYGWLQGAGNSD